MAYTDPTIVMWTEYAVDTVRQAFEFSPPSNYRLRSAITYLNDAFTACNRAKDNRSRAQVVRMRNWINAEIRRAG